MLNPTQLLMQYGVNKFSSGSMYIDMLMCMIVPLVMKYLFSKKLFELYKILPAYVYASGERKFRRLIETMDEHLSYYVDESNLIMQRAILNYINQSMQGVQHHRLDKERIADVCITRKHARADDGAENSSAKYVYHFNLKPAANYWVKLDDGVRFLWRQHIIETHSSTSAQIIPRIKTTYILECDAPDGNLRITSLIKNALQLYNTQQVQNVDTARYLYMPMLNNGSSLPSPPKAGAASAAAETQPTIKYKRYLLSSEKTFASFFHPDKHDVMRLVDQFMNGTGKFGVPGYPQKLGFLLHGPPGTGKTSFIKALADYMGRSIISVPLSQVTTNQQLMDVVFEHRKYIDGGGKDASMVTLPFHKSIFVMEDVDAASDVVKRRPTSVGSSSTTTTTSSTTTSSSPVGGSGGDDVELSVDDNSIIHSDSDQGKNSTGMRSPYCHPRENLDQLNLAGLLNVLDGVVDTPKRIIVMTTNHPESLDPALIRPGRINKQIFMGNICVAEMLDMARHYFGTLDPADEAALRESFLDNSVSPAYIECLCAECDTPSQLAQRLLLCTQFRPAL